MNHVSDQLTLIKDEAECFWNAAKLYNGSYDDCSIRDCTSLDGYSLLVPSQYLSSGIVEIVLHAIDAANYRRQSEYVTTQWRLM